MTVGEYRSYQYLEAGVDYQVFEMPTEDDRVPSRAVPTTPEQEARVARIMASHLIASAHEHLSVRPVRPADFRPYRTQGREVTPYRGIRRSGMDLVFDGGLASPTRARELWAWDDVVCDLGIRLSDWAHQDHLVPVTHVAQIDRLKAEGRVGAVLTLESASPVGGDVDRLDVLYGLGLRSIGITYSESNRLGSGLSEARDGGLTAFGRAAVRRMNQLGIIIDLAHAGDRTARDTIAASEQPVLISHAGARALWDMPRLKPDDVIRACAEAGGLIGISASPLSTVSRQHPVHTIDSVMDHFAHCVELVGIEHVAFGLDTHFGDHVAWHREWAAKDPRPQHHPVDYVDGCENPGEGMRNVIRWLVVHEYSDRDIALAAGGNVYRLVSQVWAR